MYIYGMSGYCNISFHSKLRFFFQHFSLFSETHFFPFLDGLNDTPSEPNYLPSSWFYSQSQNTICTLTEKSALTKTFPTFLPNAFYSYCNTLKRPQLKVNDGSWKNKWCFFLHLEEKFKGHTFTQEKTGHFFWNRLLGVIKFLVFPTSVFSQTDEFFRQLIILFKIEQQQNISEELNFSEKTFLCDGFVVLGGNLQGSKRCQVAHISDCGLQQSRRQVLFGGFWLFFQSFFSNYIS